MNISFFNGVSGMLTYQEDMNVLAHNVANSGTIGYKPDKSSFSDLLYTRMAVNSPEQPLVGHGIWVQDSHLVYRQGPLIQQGAGGLDFALVGDGFFAVQLPNGTTQYTRNGSFDISIEGNKGYLVNADGSHVLDASGKPIELERETQDGLFNLDGLKDRLGIYDFPNPYGLEHASGSNFKVSDNSGEAVAIIKGKVEGAYANRRYDLLENALEQSAVELADEMVNVIVSQRAFQMNAKIVQTADELEQVVNNLR